MKFTDFKTRFASLAVAYVQSERSLSKRKYLPQSDAVWNSNPSTSRITIGELAQPNAVTDVDVARGRMPGRAGLPEPCAASRT